MDTDQMRRDLVTFFDNTFIQPLNFFSIHQPGGVELDVREGTDHEMVVFVKYHGQRIPAEIWEGMKVADAIFYEETEGMTWEIVVPEWVFDSTVLHFRGCKPGMMYRIELMRSQEPRPTSRSMFTHGAD